jgi:uncharacterized protein
MVGGPQEASRTALPVGCLRRLSLDRSTETRRSTWTRRRPPHRAAAADLARRTSSELLQLECRTGAETTARRIIGRHGDPSDATVRVATLMSAIADPWPDALPVDTAGPVRVAVDQAAALWRDAAG